MTHRNERSASFDRTWPDERATLTRRELLQGAAVGAGALLLAPRIALADGGFALAGEAKQALDESPLVYVSPLHKDGRESSCHGEVWFLNDGGSVLLLTGTEGWKAEAIRTGRDRARVWAGDFGPVKKAGDKYRKAPTFLAKAERDLDEAAFKRLMEAFARKYADGWNKWRPRFKKGWDDGSRTMIRYTPIGA